MTFSTDLAELVDDVFGSAMLPSGADNPDPRDLFQTAADLGWLLVGVAETAGGSGGDLTHLAEIAAGIGRHAVSAPILETMMTQWIHAELFGHVRIETPAGANYAIAPKGSLVVSHVRDHWILNGRIEKVRWLDRCGYLLILTSDESNRPTTIVVNPMSDATISLESTIDSLGFPISSLTLRATRVSSDLVVQPAGDYDEWRERVTCRHALLRSAATVGAAQRACSLSATYIRDREQFGKPLAQLQAVAHTLAMASAERDLMISAVRRAIDGNGALFHVAAAAAVTARGAGKVAAAAHQMHGAIGITREYPLHLFTRRLWAWRDEGKSQRMWEHLVGLAAVNDDEAELWKLIVESPGTL